ncbi:MAG: arginine--tRNA ligase [Deltaproteobacteria bacterium]|nr:arginine--tRNA ligase [Deltaproteobacteria bacterium]
MADLRQALLPRFEAALQKAFGDEHAKADPVIRRSERAHFQADVAMALAKKVGKPPRDVAKAIVDVLDVSDLADVEIAGPGFININLKPAVLAEALGAMASAGKLGIEAASPAETVVVDYSSPNVAKEMHVGHVRSTVIGDALARTLEALGHRVVRQNHLGDWGTPFGMLIEHLLDLGGDATAAAASIRDLDDFYRAARGKFDGDPAFAERARQRVVLLQGGDAKTLELWRALVDTSRKYFGAVYAKLGITLKDSDVRGESFYNDKLAPVIEELEKKGLTQVSEGAVCVFPDGFKTKEGTPLPLIIRKQDGGYGYATTDLAAIRSRILDVGATRILYVVGSPQQQHFNMIFSVAKSAGWLKESMRAEHVAFGSILGPDKKMFKTRSGDTVKLAELVDEAIERARAVIDAKDAKNELDDATRAEVARMIGVGAIKYADLSSERIKDYIFDWARMLALQGNTAPYLQYAHARGCRIVSKSEAADVEASKTAALLLEAPEERALALELLGFGGVVAAVGETLQPHRLCTYLFALSNTFTQFYENCNINKEPKPAPEIRQSRLALLRATLPVLAKGLELLGIEAPQRM